MTTNKPNEAMKEVPTAASKPRNYKLSPEQLTEQVISLETIDLKVIQSAITEEILRRKEKHQKALAESE